MKRSLLTVSAQHGAAQQGLQPPKAPELGRDGKKNAAQHARSTDAKRAMPAAAFSVALPRLCRPRA
ncbi:hypothetical protein [Xanthomonas sp. GW]|uniref:hypothetical protein n=1 Tax=Xanthomonas sp. GW TaxID=2724121 RepID=UPI001639DFED|nr:hypothetical protein [Xanthomonas sp. GW]